MAAAVRPTEGAMSNGHRQSMHGKGRVGCIRKKERRKCIQHASNIDDGCTDNRGAHYKTVIKPVRQKMRFRDWGWQSGTTSSEELAESW